MARALTTAIDGLRSAIGSGEFAPGERLPTEPELCERFGVSRSSLREAVRMLGALGVVESRHGSGTYVSDLDPATIVQGFSLTIGLLPLGGLLEVFEIRRVLESHAAAQAAARCTPELEAGLAALLAEAERDGDAAAIDERFHALVCDSCDNPTIESLTKVFRSRGSHYDVFRGEDAAEVRRVSAEAHRTIADAIVARDPVLAASATGAHIAQTEAWLRRLQ